MNDTSWGKVAKWYDSHLKDDQSYHAKVILPGIQRLIGEVSGKKILDLACGQGYFSRAISNRGGAVTGVDISKELISIAEKIKSKNKINYFVSPSHDLYMLRNNECDVVVCILALQNIENIAGTFKEIKRVLRKGGKFIFILNHPAFRIPKESSWVFDDKTSKQFRRIDSYLSEAKIKIDMSPGTKDDRSKDKKYTISFHRPLQYWAKALNKEGFYISRMEEWISHKESGKGRRQKAENKARKEIPLFLAVETVQL